jgi:3-oxoacyl-[acyl-carrier protein] reductase
MNTFLTNKTALITGASGNIGREIAIQFASLGANLSICSKNDKEGLLHTKDLAEEYGVKVLSHTFDLSDSGDIKIFVSEAIQEFGAIDILVNNAVYRCPGSLDFITDDSWHQNIAVNLTAPYLLSKAVIPQMIEKQWGRIVNFSGVAAFLGHHPAKAMVKQGIIGLTRGIASEYGKHNITANCIAPGLVDVARKEWDSPERKKCVPKENQAICRLGTTNEIASAVSFLVNPSSSFITGQCIHVNGGIYFN